MALLPDADRAEGVGYFNNNCPFQAGEIDNLTKLQVRAAFNALDQFIEDNALTINQAIPQPARARLTPAQKAWMLQLVLERRYRRT